MAYHGVLAHQDNALATERLSDLVHLLRRDIVDGDDEDGLVVLQQALQLVEVPGLVRCFAPHIFLFTEGRMFKGGYYCCDVESKIGLAKKAASPSRRNFATIAAAVWGRLRSRAWWGQPIRPHDKSIGRPTVTFLLIAGDSGVQDLEMRVSLAANNQHLLN